MAGAPAGAQAGQMSAGLASKAERGKQCQGLIVPMSAKGTKQRSISTLNMSAFGGKADMSDRLVDVR